MNAGFLQYGPDYLARDANLDRMEALLDGLDADLLVLPELCATGYFFRTADELARVAEPVPDGPTTRRLHRWARTTGATLVAGLPERAGTKYYNSAVVVAPSGYVGTYRKVHLFYEEKRWFTPGDLGFPVFNVQDRQGQGYRLGVMICFDWYYPEALRTLALRGAEVVAHPSNLVRPHCPAAMPIRALENRVFTVTANRIGHESNGTETLTFIGQSLVCDPHAVVLAQAGREETGTGIAPVDLAQARSKRITAWNDLLADRRPEAYHTA